MDRRKRKREAKTREMLDTAMAIILEDGVDALTIARLAQRLDAAVGALYRYFPGKDALMVALQRQAIDSFYSAMLKDLDAANQLIAAQDVEERPATLFRAIAALGAYLRDGDRAPERHRLMDMLVSTPVPLLTDQQAAEVNNSLGPILQTCSSLLDKAAEVGAVNPSDSSLRTHLVWAALHGLDHFRKRDRIQPESLHVDRLSIEMLRTLFLGWGADAVALETALSLFMETDSDHG